MAISFKCGGCAKQYSVKDELAGKKAQCKQCGQVMTIPTMPAAHEPDLRSDMRDPSAASNASAETVAGSLIAAPTDTVTGRGSSAAGKSVAGRSVAGGSVSGRSASGRSMSGRSASGMSSSGTHRAPPQSASEPAYAPPPDMDFGEPQLSALKHVAKSEHEAFDVTGGTDQPLRTGRGPALKNRAPMEPFSFGLAALLLIALGYSAYVYMNQTVPNVPADVLAEAGKPTMVALASRATTFVVTLAVIAPLVMAAWFAACKIVNYRLPDNLFMRSLGLAAMPAIAVTIANTIPALRGSESLVALACLPLAYAMLHFVHNQKPALAGATVGLGAIGAAAGLAIASTASDSVVQALRPSYDHKVEQLALAAKEKKDATAKTDNKPAVVAVDHTASDAAIRQLQDQLTAFKNSLNNKQQTREKLADTSAQLAAAIDAGKQKFADRTEFAAMAADLESVRAQVDAFPTAQPPAELAEAPPAGADWTVRGGRKEVSASAFNLTPPLESVVDLDATDVDSGVLKWTVGNSRTTLTVEPAKAPSDKQQRPWVAPAFVADAAKDAAVTVVADGTPQVEYGTINGLPAAKVSVDAANGVSKVVYTVHKGDAWLKCTISPFSAGDMNAAAAQQAVRSIRERAAGEPKLDPMTAAVLVEQYQANPSQGEKIIGMLRQKPDAEDAVTKALGFSPDDATLAKLGPLLIATATEKSSHTLWKIAANGTPVAEQAREALRTLEPKTADDISFALLDVKSGNFTQVSKGLSVLAMADADKARQPQVSKVLSDGLENQTLIRGDTKKLEAVFEKWMDPDLARKMQTLLDTPSSRKVAIRVLGATNDKKYVMPIFNQVLTEPDLVTETLIGMGTNAETELSKLIIKVETMRSPVALKAGLAVLSEIGTQRCMSALQTIASKSGDPDAKETAKALLIQIREKSKAPQPR